MSLDRNPQAEQMAHESMVRNLAAQAAAISSQEQALFARYELPERARILDVGCGTGEIVQRLARRYPRAALLGIDVHAPHLALAREKTREHGARAEFRRGDAFALDVPDANFGRVLGECFLPIVTARVP